MDAKKMCKTALVKEVRSLRKQVRYLTSLNKERFNELRRRDAASAQYKLLQYPCAIWFHRYVEWCYKKNIPDNVFWEYFWFQNNVARDHFWNERFADLLCNLINIFEERQVSNTFDVFPVDFLNTFTKKL